MEMVWKWTKIVTLSLFIFCLFGCFDTDTQQSQITKLLITGDSEVAVTDIPPELVEYYKAHQYADKFLAYYTKYIDAGGIAIVGNHYVRDEQFYVAREVILLMTSKRPELREPLSLSNVRGDNRFRVILINAEEPLDSEFNSDYGRETGWNTIPEAPNYAQLGWANSQYIVAHIWWDHVDPAQRDGKIRFGLGVLVHEFAHALHMVALSELDPTFNEQLLEAYGKGCFSPPNIHGSYNGRFRNTYACRNHLEYWAEFVVAWVYKDAWVAWDDFTTFELLVNADDQLILPLLDEWIPKINLKPLDKLGQPIPWEWSETWSWDEPD